MNYQVVTDEEKLREFIDFLPDLAPTEQFYLCLFARSKYCKDIVHIKSDKAQLKRFTSTKDFLFDKIKQLECPIGAYKQRDVIIPQEALALYISINPRDLWKATMNTMIHLAICARDRRMGINPHQEAMSEIQKQRGTRHYVIADVDDKEGGLINLLSFLYKKIDPEAIRVIETRGGYHVLIDPEKISKANRVDWYKYIQSHPHIDQMGDIMSPVPGTYQGGFTPKLF